MTPPGGKKPRRGAFSRRLPHSLVLPETTVSVVVRPMLSMDDDNAERTVWWRCREWKCESWVASDGRQWLELYESDRVALSRPVRDAESCSRWPTLGVARSLRRTPMKSSCPSPHADGSEHGAMAIVVDVGTAIGNRFAEKLVGVKGEGVSTVARHPNRSWREWPVRGDLEAPTGLRASSSRHRRPYRCTKTRAPDRRVPRSRSAFPPEIVDAVGSSDDRGKGGSR